MTSPSGGREGTARKESADGTSSRFKHRMRLDGCSVLSEVATDVSQQPGSAPSTFSLSQKPSSVLKDKVAHAAEEHCRSQDEDDGCEEGVLLGTEALPVVGAMGVLVMPHAETSGRNKGDRDDTLFRDAVFGGWETEDVLDTTLLFEDRRREKELDDYVDAQSQGHAIRRTSLRDGVERCQTKAGQRRNSEE